MSGPIAIFLFEYSGRAAKPWAEAGIECWCVDIQHSIRKERVEGLVHFVWGDARSWCPPRGRKIIFVGASPPCTDVTVAGARDWRRKGHYLLTDALELFTAAEVTASWSGAPYYIEANCPDQFRRAA